MNEAQQEYNDAFPVGCPVVLHSLGAMWGVLTSLSGKVFRHTKDPMWSHVIELDYPVFIPTHTDEILERNVTPEWATEWSKKHECPIDGALTDKPWNRMVTVHASALIKPEDLPEEQKAFINYGYGLVPSEDDLDKRRFIRAWEWISEFAEQDLRHERMNERRVKEGFEPLPSPWKK